MATTITGRLNKHASIFQAGESTGFGIRLGVKYYDRESKTEQWCNYEAVVFAKGASQVQFYQQALVEGSIVEVSGDKQRIRQFQGANGLNLSIEILDARLGAVFSPQAGNGAPQSNRTTNAAPSQQPAQTGGAYSQQPAYNQGQHRPGAPMEPSIDFMDEIPL